MLIFIVVIKINRSGELNLKARGSQRARLTTGEGGGGSGGVGWGGLLEGGEAGDGAGAQTELP